MGVEIAINRTPQETRVAVLENKVVTELYVDRAQKKGFCGQRL
jgi:ribonuclease G